MVLLLEVDADADALLRLGALGTRAALRLARRAFLREEDRLGLLGVFAFFFFGPSESLRSALRFAFCSEMYVSLAAIYFLNDDVFSYAAIAFTLFSFAFIAFSC